MLIFSLVSMSAYTDPIVDVDVHHSWVDPSEVIRYLPKEWREVAESKPKGAFMPPSIGGSVFPNSGRILDTFAAGFVRGTEEQKLREKLVDKYNYYRCILTHDVGQYGAHPNPYYAAAVCQAVNDWNIDTWLEKDDRFYSVIVIPSSDPEAAAKEIRRVGDHPKLPSVCMAANTLGRPAGDPIYDPIYRAASDMGLHIAHHYGAADRPGHGVTMAGGHMNNGLIRISQMSQMAMTYVSSYIVHGTFEKFPDLKVLIKEYGTAWLPSVMIRLDDDYAMLKKESPWVKRLPSEYVREYMKLSTQPLEESPKQSQLIDVLGLVDGIEDLLCFSTDWPHWSADEPAWVLRHLPKSWHRKVMYQNACDFFGWDAPVPGTRYASPLLQTA
jgi:uncharacterized protein